MSGERGSRVFSPADLARPVRAGDLVLLFLAIRRSLGVWLAARAPGSVRGPEISLAPSGHLWYTILSLVGVTAAYAPSLEPSLACG